MRRVGLIIAMGLLLCPLMKAFVVASSQPLVDAENAVGDAYIAILNADNAGANVTELVNQLNDAVDLLDEAWRIYGTNQTLAEELANQAEVIANEVYVAALELLSETQRGSSMWLILISLGVIFLIVFIGIALYYSWRGMSAEKDKELLEMEVSIPEEGDQSGEG